ncbi:hypothetical protein IMAU60201_01225 [Lactobacillus helveticus]|uniref:TetR/AcrR family transcriptional regulator n=1 Tax=Lactobacillus helveticus TaxID=1587 RepID=UPI0015623B4D|nr:TetR/AcrR family transcriptional regulator [Lactobacillus helveticus]NRO60677.1 hypothetical protein [Lactobacillus helveticus]
MRTVEYSAQLILDRSTQLFDEGGLINLKVRAVAKACDCSVIPIYSNYASQKELSKKVLRNAYSIFEKSLVDSLKSHKNASLNDPYLLLYSALTCSKGLIKEVISNNKDVIDKLVRITYKYFPNITILQLREYIFLICLTINIKSTKVFDGFNLSDLAISKINKGFLKKLK